MTTPTLTLFAAPEGGASLPWGGDASGRRGAPRSGDRRRVRVGARGRLSLLRYSAAAQRGRGPAGGWLTTPTLKMFAEGRLCAAGPCRGRGAVLREFPAPPPEGGASLPWGGDASSRRGAPRSGNRRRVRVGARGRLSLLWYSAAAQRGRGPAGG